MYEEEIKDILRPLLKEEWMSDEEVDEVIEVSVGLMGGWDKITNDLIIGISNGYSIQQQLDILKVVLNKVKINDWKRI